MPLIAVIDDEAPVRTMLRRALRLADYEVAEFASGEAFLRAQPSPGPACVVLDIHMPGMSGLDVGSQVRAAQVSVPIIFITASDDASLDHAVVAAGGAELLRKPFSTDALLAAVGRALGR